MWHMQLVRFNHKYINTLFWSHWGLFFLIEQNMAFEVAEIFWHLLWPGYGSIMSGLHGSPLSFVIIFL